MEVSVFVFKDFLLSRHTLSQAKRCNSAYIWETMYLALQVHILAVFTPGFVSPMQLKTAYLPSSVSLMHLLKNECEYQMDFDFLFQLYRW